MNRPRLLYLVTEDWYFLSHRLPMAHAARAAGFDVHVATRVAEHGGAIEAEGFKLHPLPWSRESRNAALIREIASIRALYRDLKPDLLHQVALKPAILGGLAAIGLGIPHINSIAGLGSGFIAKGIGPAVKRYALETVLRQVLGGPLALNVVQNPDDEAVLRRMLGPGGRVALVPGSGVDTDGLVPLPEPEGAITVGIAARMLEDKGIRAAVAALALLRMRGHPYRLLLAGREDLSNSAAIPRSDLEAWNGREGVQWLGHVEDIPGFWARCQIACLPSRREGLPKALLEAAALGRPLVATDVPGCREIARADENALLVPPDDAEALAQAWLRLGSDANLRHRFAAAGRVLVETRFSARAVGAAMATHYLAFLDR